MAKYFNAESILLFTSTESNNERVNPKEGDWVDPVIAILMGWFSLGVGKLNLVWASLRALSMDSSFQISKPFNFLCTNSKTAYDPIKNLFAAFSSYDCTSEK